jgi:CTP synthase
LTYLPFIAAAGELKTKPTQHSVKTLQSLGIQPDMLLCRSDVPIDEKQLKKISLFCNVKSKNIIPAPNVKSIYEVPLVYHSNGLDSQIVEYFGIKDEKVDLSLWERIADTVNNPKTTRRIAVVGKYMGLRDSYKSLMEAIVHGGIANRVALEIVWINSREVNTLEKIRDGLQNIDGIIVPGGFGADGIDGKILAIQYARENNIPFLGICLGMQMAVVEFARNILLLKDANSTEFSRDTEHPVIALITEWQHNGRREIRSEDSDLGGTMRLGSYRAKLRDNSLLAKIYGKNLIEGRHRHRYEVNVNYVSALEEKGMVFSGISEDGKLMECVEIPTNRFFVGIQFHPELTSRPFSANPLFRELVKSCL